MTNIFVGNLSYQTTQDDLLQAFAAFGAVDRVSIVTDRDTGQSRGFGFVEMPNRGEADAAINGLNGTALNGRTINVNEARPRPASTGGGGGYGQRRGDGGGSGGYGGGGGGGGRGGRREPRW